MIKVRNQRISRQSRMMVLRRRKKLKIRKFRKFFLIQNPES